MLNCVCIHSSIKLLVTDHVEPTLPSIASDYVEVAMKGPTVTYAFVEYAGTPLPKPQKVYSRQPSTGRGKLPAHVAISFFISLIIGISPPATLALKSLSLLSLLGKAA
jgi:hypothetical protein